MGFHGLENSDGLCSRSMKIIATRVRLVCHGMDLGEANPTRGAGGNAPLAMNLLRPTGTKRSTIVVSFIPTTLSTMKRVSGMRGLLLLELCVDWFPASMIS